MRFENAIHQDANTEFEVDLEKQTFMITSTGEASVFEINPYKKHCLKNGLDDIDYLVEMKEQIAEFETAR